MSTQHYDQMYAALKEIKRLLSAASNDGKSAAVKESNANQAWHVANNALASQSDAHPPREPTP